MIDKVNPDSASPSLGSSIIVQTLIASDHALDASSSDQSYEHGIYSASSTAGAKQVKEVQLPVRLPPS